MNDTGLENRLARALNTSVDRELGAPRPAPPFVPRDSASPTAHRRGPNWNRIVLAAACVIAVLAGAVAIVYATNHHATKTPPVSQAPSPTPTAHTVSVGGAQLVLPTGWNATAEKGDPGTWCLAPASQPTNCATTFQRIDKVNGGYPVDADADGGVGGDPGQVCAPGVASWSVDYGVRELGGRTAQWRQFAITCTQGKKTTRTLRHEQYVVDTLTGYVLYTTDDTAATRRVVESIAARSTLPKQTAPLTLAENAVVRQVTTVATGTRIRVQRVARPEPASSTVSAASGTGPMPTATYDVPAKVYDRIGSTLRAGDTVLITTNGTAVTSVVKLQ